jgi:hypothetical protein
MSDILEESERRKTRTFLTVYYYHSAMAMVAAFYANHNDRKKSYALIHEHLETHPWFITDIPHIYNSNINNIVDACIKLGQYDEAMDWISVQRSYMQKFRLKNEAMSARIFLNTHEHEIQIYTHRQHYRKGILLGKAIEQGLRKFGEYYQGEQYDLVISLAMFLFSGKDYRGAARMINRIVSVRVAIQPLPEIMISARLALLIIHYINRERNLSYQLKSARRWLKKHSSFQSAGVIVRFLEAMHEKRSLKEKKLACITQWKTLVKLQSDPNEKLLTKYFDFAQWMKTAAQIKSA